MILTCYRCPLQLAFPGKNVRHYLRAFHWARREGRYLCRWCA